MLEANLVKLCLPDPPTPTSSAFPPGLFNILAITSRCSMAKLNSTKSIGLSVIML